MQEPIQHDPRTKQQIKDALYAFLYDPVQHKFTKRLEELITRNSAIGGFPHKSFVHKGVLYNCDTTPPPRRANRLLPQLIEPMNEYLKEVKQLNEQELPMVLGFINQVLNSSNDLHDYLRLLPESMHPPIQKLIDTCPCRTRKLAEDVVADLQAKNLIYINLMKQRLVTNLLI